MSGKLMVVAGGQFGSEGKGAIAGYLSKVEKRRLFAVRVAGPNAGHTVYDNEGREFKLRTLPVAAVTNHGALLGIAAGSEVDEAVLEYEIEVLEKCGHPVRNRLYIDAQATVLGSEHIKQETDQNMHKRIGSTGKGIGAARADRIWRTAAIWGEDHDGSAIDVAAHARSVLNQGGSVLIEGTQGYGLGLHAGFYPQCTSSDCRGIDFLSMAGLSPWAPYVTEFENWVVFRTYPIRVAGNSGPLRGETTWEDLGFEPERTTVTNLVRRVGEWDPDLAAQAMLANGGPGRHVKVALTFLDYVVPDMANKTIMSDEGRRALQRYQFDLGQHVDVVGTGPNSVVDLR